MTVLRQVCELIPAYLVSVLARQHGVDARNFSAWSHVVAMLYAQLSHAFSLNDVCDGLRMRVRWLYSIRGAKPPARNTFSNANRTRESGMAESLFWKMHEHLSQLYPKFAKGNRLKGYMRRFKTVIYAVDATTIQLAANCLDWAKHRRRKAAAKCHMRLNLQSFLPTFAVVDTAREHDSLRAHEVCAGLKEGEIVVFDKAYVDFSHLHQLNQRDVQWVSRAKENMACRVFKKLPASDNPRILRDDLIVLTGPKTKKEYPQSLRRVRAIVEIDGKDREMEFITNNTEWSPLSVCELYRCRWSVEVFFKELKQNVQLADFLGHNANAVRWQVWIALLTHLLLRFLAWLSNWPHSFSRIVTFIRAALWLKTDLSKLLKNCGTADPPPKLNQGLKQPWLVGLEHLFMGQPT